MRMSCSRTRCAVSTNAWRLARWTVQGHREASGRDVRTTSAHPQGSVTRPLPQAPQQADYMPPTHTPRRGGSPAHTPRCLTGTRRGAGAESQRPSAGAGAPRAGGRESAVEKVGHGPVSQGPGPATLPWCNPGIDTPGWRPSPSPGPSSLFSLPAENILKIEPIEADIKLCFSTRSEIHC